ncbi:MAG: PSD1 and planctomycete cytochrome C domain-containing protein [Gemmataceae bacterium]
MRIAISFLGLLLIPRLAGAQGPDFTREVRPILSRFCFKCHGPDEKNRKADLRLDVRAGAIEAAIVPGQPEKSELVQRIFAHEKAKVMPPPSTKMTLSPAQKDILKRWIAAGAEYQPHWAYVAPKAGPLPAIKDESWGKGPIDAFILARLEAEGLKPAAPADRYTLIRRLSLDLIGLPPTPEEVDAFVSDKAPDAYEKLVDRLLASPRYGERWARRWLDLARYADTNGYEKDRPRIIWPYRDWVIKALNDDMPFDRFTIEQIAGDLLPGATPAQIVATGFHRNTMVNEEGGIDPLEFRYYAVVDRVNTTATAWLGLTFGCAQCHTHKYDPITQREYYRMMAFLNNADEPDYEIPDPAIAKRRGDIEARIAKLEEALPGKFSGGTDGVEAALKKWIERESATAVEWQVVRPVSWKTSMPHLGVLEDGSILASGDQNKSDTYELRLPDFKGATALRLEALPDASLPDQGPGRTYYEGRKGDFFLSELSLAVAGKPVKFVAASQDYSSAAFGAGKVGAQFCYDGLAETGWSTTDQPGRAHEAVFHFEKPVDVKGESVVKMLFERHYACGLGRFRLSFTIDPRKGTANSHGAAITAILAKPGDKRTAAEKGTLRRRFLETTPELAAARKEIESLRASLPAYQMTMVMRERPDDNKRPTHIHHRGEFLQPKEKVEPGVLSLLHPFPKDAPRNRLGLARWLVSPDNPLTPRVVVNREWQAFFGRGIVKTLEDFGYQGEAPTHPELLDWLAVQFVKDGWSLKALHKRIVMSAAYQQSSAVSADLLKRDPDNRLLARGPRVRLEAEMIRDSLLTASGQLSKKIGGPSVFPPQPASLTTEGVYGAIKWTPSSGEDRYRRGLYAFLKRSIPYGMFATFDGVSGETCVARREVSNTPLQALTMLNDLVVIETAQALGEKTAALKGTERDRVVHLFRRCLVRPPSDKEAETLLAFLERQRGRLRKGELKAATIAGPGTSDALERAAWTLTARAVLNLDEMITKE